MENLFSTGVKEPLTDFHLRTAAEELTFPSIIKINNRVLCHLTLDEWQAFADAHADRTIFHHRNWIELLSDTYGFKPLIPAVKENGQILAAIPLLETKNIWGARKLISLPCSDCMSILAKSRDAVEWLCWELTADKYREYKSIVVRTEQPFRLGRTARWGRHVIDTSRPLKEIVANFDRTLRTNLRRTEKCKLAFQFSQDASELEEFYRFLLKTRKKHGVPIQPKSFFRGLHNRILSSNLGYIGLARDGENTIAAGIFLCYGGKMMCKYLASDSNALDKRPNEFLLYQGIRMAVEMGCSTFDFGISKREQEGLRRFKSKFGATENDVYNDYIAGEVQPLLDESRAMKIVSATVRHSPTVISRALGELFYRYSQ